MRPNLLILAAVILAARDRSLRQKTGRSNDERAAPLRSNRSGLLVWKRLRRRKDRQRRTI